MFNKFCKSKETHLFLYKQCCARFPSDVIYGSSFGVSHVALALPLCRDSLLFPGLLASV